MTKGLSNINGRSLSGQDHLIQSIKDILGTPIGSRVAARDYGSRLYELIDAPMSGTLVADIIQATAEALSKWEPRYLLKKVLVVASEAGHYTFDLEGEYLPTGKPLSLEGIVV